ncbi:MAG: hypothetical protein ACE5KV_02325 [Thermoplasmata archaeon]
MADSVLKNSDSDDGGTYQEQLMEQYKLYVEMADRISGRRGNANSFFLMVITVLVSTTGIVFGFGSQDTLVLGGWLVIVSISGTTFCFTWYRTLESYRQLSSGKFKVIHRIEKKLPIALYSEEWKELGEGKNPKLYRKLTDVERWVPSLFGILFVVLLVLGMVVLAPSILQTLYP